jgi:hypothetical protein
MSEYLMEMVGYNVEGTAEWRRRKAEEFPQDTRNLEASEQLERLAAEIGELEGSEIETQISELQEQISDPDIWISFGEDVSSELRSIGFNNGCSNATEFLKWYRDLLKEKLLLKTVERQKSLESRVRRKAGRRRHAIYKSRDRSTHYNNHGEYMLADSNNYVVLGSNYDASLGEIEEYLRDVPLYGRAS